MGHGASVLISARSHADIDAGEVTIKYQAVGRRVTIVNKIPRASLVCQLFAETESQAIVACFANTMYDYSRSIVRFQTSQENHNAFSHCKMFQNNNYIPINYAFSNLIGSWYFQFLNIR